MVGVEHHENVLQVIHPVEEGCLEVVERPLMRSANQKIGHHNVGPKAVAHESHDSDPCFQAAGIPAWREDTASDAQRAGDANPRRASVAVCRVAAARTKVSRRKEPG